MFGSDYPVCLRAASYPEVLESFQVLLEGLDDQEQTLIFARTPLSFTDSNKNTQDEKWLRTTSLPGRKVA